jgi:hypothetical protein
MTGVVGKAIAHSREEVALLLEAMHALLALHLGIAPLGQELTHGYHQTVAILIDCEVARRWRRVVDHAALTGVEILEVGSLQECGLHQGGTRHEEMSDHDPPLDPFGIPSLHIADILATPPRTELLHLGLPIMNFHQSIIPGLLRGNELPHPTGTRMQEPHQ